MNLAALPRFAHAGAPIGVRVLPSSMLTDNPCNAPCRCIVDPIPMPVGGHLPFAITPSNPENAVLRGSLRFVIPSAEFPNVSVSLSAAHSDCTTLHMHLDRAEICSANFDNGGGIPDDAVTIDDLLGYLAQIELGCSIADIENTFNDGIPDQAATIDNLLACLIHFKSGCRAASLESSCSVHL